MSPRYYSFESRWSVPTKPGETFDVLADLEGYARWWPDVRHVEGIDDNTARVAVRASLPYVLRLVLHRRKVDAGAGRLVAEISGDLEGWASWHVLGTDPATPGADPQAGDIAEGTSLHYLQEVVTTHPWMNLAGPWLAPAFRLNHTAMMRRGEAGLRRYLRS